MTEHHTYKIEDVPTTGDGRTRFALATTPAGWPSQPTATLALVYGTLVEERRRQAPPNQPAPISVPLFYPVHEDGEWRLVKRGDVTARPSRENTRPGKYRATKLGGGELLDDFFLGGKSYADCRDETIWEALRQLAEEESPPSGSLRKLADLTAVLVALRAGVEVHPDALPYPAHQRRKVAA